MADIFEPIVEKLIDLGFYTYFFPWLITSAIFYGLLRKSKVLGDSPVINGVIAMSIAFLIFGFTAMTGFTLALPMARFFTQGIVILLFLVIGFLAASMFYPDMMTWLGKVFEHRTMLIIMIVLGLALMITSGLVGVFWAAPPAEPGEVGLPTDIIIIAAGLIIFIVLIIIAASFARG